MAGKPMSYGGYSFPSLAVRNEYPISRGKIKYMFFKRRRIKNQKPLKRWLSRAVRCTDCRRDMAMFIRINKPEDRAEMEHALMDKFTGVCDGCEVEQWWDLVKAIGE